MNKNEQIARIIVAPDARSDADISLTWNTVSNIVREQALRTADRILEMFGPASFIDNGMTLEVTAVVPETPPLTWRTSLGTYSQNSNVINNSYYQIVYHSDSGNRDGRDFSVVCYSNGARYYLTAKDEYVTLTDAKRIAKEHYDKTLPVLRS